MATKNEIRTILQQIDNAVATYYDHLNISNYRNKDGIGKFLEYAKVEELDDDDPYLDPIENELGDESNPHDCSFVFNVNYTWPIPPYAQIPHTETDTFMHGILQYCYKHNQPPSDQYIQTVIVPKCNGTINEALLHQATGDYDNDFSLSHGLPSQRISNDQSAETLCNIINVSSCGSDQTTNKKRCTSTPNENQNDENSGGSANVGNGNNNDEKTNEEEEKTEIVGQEYIAQMIRENAPLNELISAYDFNSVQAQYDLKARIMVKSMYHEFKYDDTDIRTRFNEFSKNNFHMVLSDNKTAALNEYDALNILEGTRWYGFDVFGQKLCNIHNLEQVFLIQFDAGVIQKIFTAIRLIVPRYLSKREERVCAAVFVLKLPRSFKIKPYIIAKTIDQYYQEFSKSFKQKLREAHLKKNKLIYVAINLLASGNYCMEIESAGDCSINMYKDFYHKIIVKNNIDSCDTAFSIRKSGAGLKYYMHNILSAHLIPFELQDIFQWLPRCCVDTQNMLSEQTYDDIRNKYDNIYVDSELEQTLVEFASVNHDLFSFDLTQSFTERYHIWQSVVINKQLSEVVITKNIDQKFVNLHTQMQKIKFLNPNQQCTVSVRNTKISINDYGFTINGERMYTVERNELCDILDEKQIFNMYGIDQPLPRLPPLYVEVDEKTRESYVEKLSCFETRLKIITSQKLARIPRIGKNPKTPKSCYKISILRKHLKIVCGKNMDKKDINVVPIGDIENGERCIKWIWVSPTIYYKINEITKYNVAIGLDDKCDTPQALYYSIYDGQHLIGRQSEFLPFDAALSKSKLKSKPKPKPKPFNALSKSKPFNVLSKPKPKPLNALSKPKPFQALFATLKQLLRRQQALLNKQQIIRRQQAEFSQLSQQPFQALFDNQIATLKQLIQQQNAESAQLIGKQQAELTQLIKQQIADLTQLSQQITGNKNLNIQ